MKTATLGVIGIRRVTALVLLAGVLCGPPRPALGNLFVADAGPFNMEGHGTIGEYTESGATVNASLITGLSFPASVAVSDGFIYVTNFHDGTIGKYTTSGVPINPTLISGLNVPVDIEVSGGDLYVAEVGAGRVGKYTTSGATINASLITGLQYATGLAISGTNLFVGTDFNTLGEYTTSGATTNASLITDLQGISAVEVSGSNLFVSHGHVDDTVIGKYTLDGTAIDPLLIFTIDGEFAISATDLFLAQFNTVGKYTTSGDLVTHSLIPPLGTPIGFQITGIAVDGPATVPETLSSLWFGLTTVGLLAFARLLRARDGRSPEHHIKGVDTARAFENHIT